MKIPDKIKVAGRIVEIQRSRSADIQGEIGTFSSWRNRIQIANDEDLDPQQAGVSLLHEIIECLNNRFEYKIPHGVLQGLAENLYQILYDNDLDFRNKGEEGENIIRQTC